ncbi:MAG TPA: hypothetical protein VFJ85_06535 [Acidimicrobiales bacterium]|nr:hypothetical protein [Acidimicrobiales bacterium]
MARSQLHRFEKFVDRQGEHHLWTGATRPGVGTGRLRIDGKEVPAHRMAWELANGALEPGDRVLPCPDEPACVRVEHLRGPSGDDGKPKRRGRKGTGSMRQVRAGTWQLAAPVRTANGVTRRTYRTVRADSAAAAARELAAFVAELQQAGPAPDPDRRDLTVDQAMAQFLDEHLAGEKGREERTITEYRRVHERWFSPEIGRRRVRDVDEAMLDRVFGKMRTAGLSRSRLNLARSLYAPFFRWARSRRIITRNPMAEFQLPTSTYVSRERVPPEVAELSMLLVEAVEAAPEIAPLLALGAVTGMRRGELVGLRRSRIRWDEHRLLVDTAMSGTRIKSTKTRRERSLYIDGATVAMLRRHCEEIDERAAIVGAEMNADPYVFTLALDGSVPMSPDYVTRRVGVLKGRLGIEEKKPGTVAREDEALRLFRQEPAPRPATVGPPPKGGLSLREIGVALGRSERWAALAIAAAERREAAGQRSLSLSFDGSILALRKFTSSELLDAGFNVSMVAQRQGHGPQVLVKHYAKSRRSSDRKAAEHLGRLVHETRSAGGQSGTP